ncbi:T-cell activation Rho GTPase-activating protein-like, partial [Falco peregrinus]|uniref:T-cell activation Rho GTPase-activating protein-like n=2 Tax=Falco peregrinus TaxID=8954 RepID=UPI002478E678
MSCVHYKFSSRLNSDVVTFHGPHISLRDLRRQIMGRERLKATHCDLQVTNAQTMEEYTDDNALIPRHSSVTVRRVPVRGVKATGKTDLGTPEGRTGARVTHLTSIKLLERELSCRHAFGQPLAALCGEDNTLPRPIQELLAVLRQQGPATEGIFRRAAGGTELRQLREALDRGKDIDVGSQPALLLAVILKDFLRSIPTKLLVVDLYEDWMAAMERASKQARVEELKAVADKLPAANLLLLKRLMALLQHIGHNAATSRMSCSNLAICVGPNL